MTARLPTLFIPHGGGPCFFMKGLGPRGCWDPMAHLSGISRDLPAPPRAILIVSGHWEEDAPRVTGHASPKLIYDYDGFPPHTYKLRYPAPGALAGEVAALLAAAGFPAAGVDPGRGFDHGVFIPMMLSFPEASIPVVQLSSLAGRDPGAHLRLGAALEPLRGGGVLIIGSGMSYHNMAGFSRGTPVHAAASENFDAWLAETVQDPDPQARNRRLAAWDTAPSAREAHPEEEHLLPLMVAAGAGDRGRLTFSDTSIGVRISAYAFG